MKTIAYVILLAFAAQCFGSVIAAEDMAANDSTNATQLNETLTNATLINETQENATLINETLDNATLINGTLENETNSSDSNPFADAKNRQPHRK